MANEISRDVYKQYAKKITSILNGDDFYNQFKQRVDKGSSDFKLAKKRLIQDISLDWIATIEDVLPNLDTIVRNPRKFIVQEEDIVDVALARSISTESVKFLAQHTNMISKVDKDGSVTPSKILNISKEESFEIYENRFIYTLLLKLKDFVTMRYDKIKKATSTQDVLELDLESRFNLPSKKVTMRTEYFAQLSFDEVMRLDPETLSKVERIAKIDRIITDFLSSSFCKSMRNSAPVRPPIMRTNVILKEPNFKKALTLWQFVETYNVTAGFSTSDEVEDYDIEPDSKDRLRELVTLNTMLFESLYDQCETDMDMEDKEFADFLRVGDMDFQKDKLDRDEYAQKLDEEVENEDEDERIEQVKPQDDKDAETEIAPEKKQEQENQESQEKPEIPPESEKEVEKEIEKEVEKEVPLEVEKEVIKEVERIIEVEKFKEMAPRDVENELDLEPDADKFDEHLFEVRKIFKRPDQDKIKQEEIIKVKDAIDRCLNSYRKIKQDELDERDRQERIKRRREDIEKRAAAFKKAREDMAAGVQDDATTFFGVDPFAAQKAKIAKKKAEEVEKAKLKVNKHESLDLDNPQIDAVQKEYDENKRLEDEKARKDAETDKKLDRMNDVMPIQNDEALRTNRPNDYELNDEEIIPQPQKEELVAVEDATEKRGIVFTEKVEPHDVYKVDEVKTVKKNKEKTNKPKLNLGKLDDPYTLSPTTANQKYSTPSGKAKVLNAVDENKVQVGDINIKEDDRIKPWTDANLGKLGTKDEPKEVVKEEKVEKAPKKDKKVEKKVTPPKPKEPKEKKEPKAPKEKRLIVQERVKQAVITDGMRFSSLDNPYELGNTVKPWTDAKLGKIEKDENSGDDK